MPWPSAVQTVNMTDNNPLPDSELIRREVLQRSWQRDKEVSARRLRIRWAVWALCRYGLPLLFVLGTAFAVWIWGLPQLRMTLAALPGKGVVPTVGEEPASDLPATPSSVPMELPAALPPAASLEATEVSPTPPDRSDGEQDPIRLRPERGVSSSDKGAPGQVSLDGTDATNTPKTVPTPDFGSQSKEP